jgi:biopolymer transport protein ExbD
MKCLLSVCLIALLAVAIGHVVEQSANASQDSSAALQKGVSITMASASNAQPMPEADNGDAWIVTVTADGQLYFGVDPLTPAALQERMIRTPRKRTQRLYIKADARASFAGVQKALSAASGAEIESPVLLVTQHISPKPGAIVAPEGLEILIGPALPAGTVATVVHLLNSGQQLPLLRVNDDDISQSSLESTLRKHFQKGDDKVILLKADTRLPFGQIVQVIDACRAAGASVVVATPVV